MKRYKLAETASVDIKGVADYTADNFGPAMRTTYNDLFRLGVANIVADPLRRGVTVASHLGDGIHVYHLRHVQQPRVKSPRHMIVYRLSASGFITILRVLHDRVDPHRHVDNDN
ncbi:MAG: type II toxin-antitoxin system RelE/ParE family toxin [Niveispirillum sp.]|uniref:type II toxin-antitoxin system RelE/ParE family toxin n=1 Tax=Niveispirillum sp. TaxID=1917217 RepID=UPI003BA3FC30